MTGNKVRFDSPFFLLTELADGVYVAMARPTEGGTIANIGLIDLGDSALVFDSFMLPQAAQELLEVTGKLIGKPVRFLVNSHAHNDHIFGNQVFPPETLILSTHRTREQIISDTPPYITFLKENLPTEMAAWKKQLDETEAGEAQAQLTGRIRRYSLLGEVLDDLIVCPPTITFEGQLHIQGSERRVELLSYGQMHAEDDAILYLPDERIIFMGDTLDVQAHPYMPDGDLDNWRTALSKVKELDFDTAVPGHGSLGGRTDFDTLLAYFDTVEAMAKKLIAEGGSAEEAAKLEIPPAYQDWSFNTMFPLNMQSLHAHFSGDSAPSSDA